MAAKFKVTFDPPNWRELILNRQLPVATAAVAALRDVAAESVQEGRQNIGAAGPGFTAKWQSGLQFLTKDATQDGKPSLQAKATIFHRYGIAGVFEHGAVIQGHPLLWIPTTPGGPPASRSGITFTSATINGTPVLFDAKDKDRHRKPLYIGVPSVRIPKKFRITEIVKEHLAKFAELFAKHFKDN